MTLYDDLLKMKVPVEVVYDNAGGCFGTLRVASNGPQGGDAGHGCRTMLELINEGMECELTIDTGGEEWIVRSPYMVRLVLGGDTEHQCMTQLLQAAAVLLNQHCLPCLDPPEPQCELCWYHHQRLAEKIRPESMPCHALLWRWEGGDEAFERTLADELAAMDDVYAVDNLQNPPLPTDDFMREIDRF